VDGLELKMTINSSFDRFLGLKTVYLQNFLFFKRLDISQTH